MSSILYGNLEPGGVVNLVTKKPLEEPFANKDYDRATSVGRQERSPDDPIFLIDIFTEEADPVPNIEPEELTSFVRDENIRAI